MDRLINAVTDLVTMKTDLLNARQIEFLTYGRVKNCKNPRKIKQDLLRKSERLVFPLSTEQGALLLRFAVQQNQAMVTKDSACLLIKTYLDQQKMSNFAQAATDLSDYIKSYLKETMPPPKTFRGSSVKFVMKAMVGLKQNEDLKCLGNCTVRAVKLAILYYSTSKSEDIWGAIGVRSKKEKRDLGLMELRDRLYLLSLSERGKWPEFFELIKKFSLLESKLGNNFLVHHLDGIKGIDLRLSGRGGYRYNMAKHALLSRGLIKKTNKGLEASDELVFYQKFIR